MGGTRRGIWSRGLRVGADGDKAAKAKDKEEKEVADGKKEVVGLGISGTSGEGKDKDEGDEGKKVDMDSSDKK